MNILEKFGDAKDLNSINFCRAAYQFMIGPKEVQAPKDNKDESEKIITVPQVIDLGLPSGTLWCDRNVGASSPWEHGAFFSWGNIEPHYPRDAKSDWGDDEDAFNYSFDSDTYEKTEGFKLTGDIDIEHDAARVNMGESWQMPTDDQFQELYDNCTLERKTIHGVNGCLFTSKINGNSLFFACSGLGAGTSWGNRGSIGYYWSSSFSSVRSARNLGFYSGGVYPQDYNSRFYGFAVRPVQNKQ